MPVGAPHPVSAAEFIPQCDSEGHFVCYLVAYEVLNTSPTISGGRATQATLSQFSFMTKDESTEVTERNCLCPGGQRCPFLQCEVRMLCHCVHVSHRNSFTFVLSLTNFDL